MKKKLITFCRVGILLLLIGVPWKMQAATLEGRDNALITFTDYSSSGYIQIKFPIFEESGEDEFMRSASAISVVINGTTTKLISFYTNKDGSYNDNGNPFNHEYNGTKHRLAWFRPYLATSGVNAQVLAGSGGAYDQTAAQNYSWYNLQTSTTSRYLTRVAEDSSNGDIEVGYTTVRIYFQEDWIGKDMNFIVNLDFSHSSNGSHDYYLRKEYNVSAVSYPTPTLTYDLSSTKVGHYQVTGTIQRPPSSNLETLYYEHNGTIGTTFQGSTFNFNYPVSDAASNINGSVKYIIGEYPSGAKISTTKTANLKLEAYPLPKKMTAIQDVGGKIKLEWEMATTGDQRGTFDIQRANNKDFSNAVTIASGVPIGTGTKKTYIEDASDLNLNGTFYYRVRRTNNSWQWNSGAYAQTSVKIASKHIEIKTDTVTLEGNKATITWKLNDPDYIWSSGSKLVISRVNITAGGSSERIEVTQEMFDKGSFVDELFVMCNRYRYDLYIQPGSTSYTKQEPVSTISVVPTEMGSLVSIDASKGYYVDRVLLEWETDGGTLNEYIVSRREHGSGKNFQQIDKVDGSLTSTRYMYEDTRAIPGIIYDYSIQGLIDCAGDIKTSNMMTVIGFRTPTGEIYGRLTFENGQPVENVVVNISSEDVLPAKSLKFTSSQTAKVHSTKLLKENTDAVTLQAWISPSAPQIGVQKIISKEGMYELGIEDDHAYFMAGTTKLTVDTISINASKSHADFIHITGVLDGTDLLFYLDGKLVAQTSLSSSIIGNNNSVVLGGNYEGIIDEVRIWKTALSPEGILRDYDRYITGGEKDLLAYWTFNYSTEDEFYDVSYLGNDYNSNHGKMNGAVLSNNIPSIDQLSYRAITATDGTYTIRSLPYIGSGTLYQVMPKKGIHTFSPIMAVRTISQNSQSHTLDFVDNSSFPVYGYVTYANSTIPVEGVEFKVDGVSILKKNGMSEVTDANGRFDIRVPVGTHEVKAVKSNHIFELDGRFTNPDGTDINYQDELGPIELTDITTVKYIGRVAGGTIQESYPLGHSLSKNNLAEGITVTLTHTKTETLVFNNKTVTEKHFLPSNKTKAKSNQVDYIDNKVIIHVNDETGEFVANVIPEKFTVNVEAAGHMDIPNSGSQIDLTQKFIQTDELHAYTDSLMVNGNWTYQSYSDTVRANFSQKFIKRYAPTFTIEQINQKREVLPYFGNLNTARNNLLGEIDSIPLFNEQKGYTFEKPVFVQHENYNFKMKLFEEYTRYKADGKTVIFKDQVPTQDAIFKMNNDIADINGKSIEIEADENGMAIYSFKAGDPELTTATKRLNASATYGDTSNSTSIAWVAPNNFIGGEAYVMGSIQTGTNFVTAGPDKLLTILRDPPGSNSYSFLEKGISFSSSSTYVGSVKNVGTENVTTGVKTEQVVFAGVGTGKVEKMMETESGFTLGFAHEEEYIGKDGRKATTTTTTKFQTSDDPMYVGADGDVYIGYSTNTTFGTTKNVTFIDRDMYDKSSDTFESTYILNDNWALVQEKGQSVNVSFNTLFAYPQIHIEETLIPQIKSIINGILLPQGLYSEAELQARANTENKAFYISYFSPDNEHYGKSNDDESLKSFLSVNGNKDDFFNGPSYKIIMSQNSGFITSDTINLLNQSIANWEKQLAANEEAKANAVLLQNYSFHSGSPIEYSETYSMEETHEDEFHITVGLHYNNDLYTEILGPKWRIDISEDVSTTQGREYSTEEEKTHTKGFVLAESSGDDDYLTVDVCREKGWTKEGEQEEGKPEEGEDEDENENEYKYYTSFIFKTKGGVTACPYEGKYVSKYYQPGKHVLSEATMRLEVPGIDMPVKFIENVPSGESAKLQLYLMNNSEVNADIYFDLKLLDESNPNGAKLSIDGTGVGNGRVFLVPAGQTLVKTLEVAKGAVMNYDDLQLILASQCQYNPTDFQEDIADTVTFSVHFTPSCSPVNLKKPSDNWTYNTKLPTVIVNGIEKKYMDVQINGFNVNYDNFDHIELKYKSASKSDLEWVTLKSYYSDTIKYNAAIKNGIDAETIKASDAGTITYRFFMDDIDDQYYDLCAASYCNVNNVLYETMSEIHSGIKDTYLPRLFGSAQPANGILGIEDEIRLNFNEKIAEGLLTRNNFQVQGIRNGSITDHSVSVDMDGISDYMQTEFEKNLTDKNITIEMWINPAEVRNATFFSHGNTNESLELSMTADKYLQVKIGDNTIKSKEPLLYDQGSWAHVALVYEAGGYLTAYYNFSAVINRTSSVDSYNGIGNFVVGKSIASSGNNYYGKIHNIRIWEKTISSMDLQSSSLAQLSGNEAGLIGYYPMNEGKGATCEDKARGATLIMNGCKWVMPDGFAVKTNGANYLQLDGSTAAITKDMDFTIEFWFKAEPGQTNATMFSNGRGDGMVEYTSDKSFSIGFDEKGSLAFIHNSHKSIIDGDYQDNNWHHFALSVNRTYNRGQIYMDGNLTTYIDGTYIGGISSPYMFIGARGYYSVDNINNLIVDNYFKGAIDDLRFWNLYRNERIVRDNNNVKLSGKEMGLLHYYPFDYYITHQGIKYVEFTNKDMNVSDEINPDTDTFIVVGSSEETVKSKEIAPLKDLGPVADLDFDFVVNNDALIVNLKETEYRIDKTIITFTVNDVRDVNGNSIASPITWTAYIDRNMLKWSESQLNLEKEVYEGLEFTVRIHNNGGSIQNYVINNVPSWLEITPSFGTLKPSSQEEIKFKVNPGLNIGTYNDVIYLTNEENVSEALTLNLRVLGEKPNWSVNPSDFQYSMSVIGQMRFNNLFSGDGEDMLAVFSNGKCVGIANSSYNKTFDIWYTLLTIYGNDKYIDNLEFRMWDASTGRTYKAVPDRQITFINDAIAGTVDDPVIFDGINILYQNIALTEGWNWISFNLANELLPNVNATLENGTWNKNNIVKDKNYFDSYSSSKGWVGTLSKNGGFNNMSMFMVHSSQDQILSVFGTSIDPKTMPITIKGKQWNYIGYLPTVNTTVKEALAGYEAQAQDVIKSKDSFAMFSRNEWVGNLIYMEANKGYMLYRTANNDVTFTYPSISGSLGNLRSDNSTNIIQTHNYAENMNVIATWEGINNDDQLLVYVNNELRGAGSVVSSKENRLGFITIAGDEQSQDIRFDLLQNGKVVGSTYADMNYTSNQITGTVEEPIVLNFGEERNDVISVYPNPFKTKFNIQFTERQKSLVEIRIFDVLGKLVMIHQASDTSNIELDGSDLMKGFYFIKITANGESTICKIEKL